MRETAVMVNIRDRPSELAMLLQSLRTQTYKDFDIFILDDQSGTPLQNYHFINCVINRLVLEGNRVFVKRTEFPHGVSKARQAIVDWVLETGNYNYLCRVDDDVVLDQEFLARLYTVIQQGYDLASGVTPPMTGPVFAREPESVGRIINRVVLDEQGNYKFNGDDCGILYTKSMILPAHHFRSSLLYKSEIHKKVNYLPTKLSKHGFREEQIFSYKALLAGYTIGVDTAAIAWHQLTPSGGERFSDSNELIKSNQLVLEEWTKEHKDELRVIFGDGLDLTEADFKKETNLIKI